MLAPARLRVDWWGTVWLGTPTAACLSHSWLTFLIGSHLQLGTIVLAIAITDCQTLSACIAALLFVPFFVRNREGFACSLPIGNAISYLPPIVDNLLQSNACSIF